MSASPTPPTGGSQIIAGVTWLALAIAYFTVLSGFRPPDENRSVDTADKGILAKDEFSPANDLTLQ